MIDAVDTLLNRMAASIAGQFETASLRLVGIRTGGWWLTQALHERLQLSAPAGVLDITFYRDDFSRVGVSPKVGVTELPWSIDDQHLLLVDDVLASGRTVRAAINELHDFGRPARVALAVALDRGGRELPIAADIVGQRLMLEAHQQIKLRGPESLAFQITEKGT